MTGQPLLCECGHTEGQHGATNPTCLVCISCDPDGRATTAHVATKCPCVAFTPRHRCDICGTGIYATQTVCTTCATVARIQ